MGRRTLVLAIAVLLAAVSGYALFSYLTSVEDDIKSGISEVIVYWADGAETSYGSLSAGAVYSLQRGVSTAVRKSNVDDALEPL